MFHLPSNIWPVFEGASLHASRTKVVLRVHGILDISRRSTLGDGMDVIF